MICPACADTEEELPGRNWGETTYIHEERVVNFLKNNRGKPIEDIDDADQR